MLVESLTHAVGMVLTLLWYHAITLRIGGFVHRTVCLARKTLVGIGTGYGAIGQKSEGSERQ